MSSLFATLTNFQADKELTFFREMQCFRSQSAESGPEQNMSARRSANYICHKNSPQRGKTFMR